MTAAAIHVDIADTNAVDPFAPAVWGTTLWGDPDEFWGGVLPSWSDLTCRVMSVEIERGRADVFDVFEAGRCVVTVVNEDGWASWSPDEPNPVNAGAWLRVRATDDLGEHILFTGTLQAVNDSYEPGEVLTATLTCVDFLARLAMLELPARPAVGAGDTAAQRIQRCLDEIMWPPELTMLDPGGPTLTATVMEGTMIDEAQRSAVAAGGHLYCSSEGILKYRDAWWLTWNPRPTDLQADIANDGRPGALCAVGMEVNGPDVATVRNRATVSGVDEGAEETITVEVTRVNQTALRFGPASWSVSDLPTIDTAQLTTLADRVLRARAEPTARARAVTLSPVADPASAHFCAEVGFGDRVDVSYTDPDDGWSWSLTCHVHGIIHSIEPSGTPNEAGSWLTTLRLDDATVWPFAWQWDAALWGEARWTEQP